MLLSGPGLALYLLSKLRVGRSIGGDSPARWFLATTIRGLRNCAVGKYRDRITSG